MWNQMLLLTMLQLLYVSSRSIEPIEGPLWLNRLNDILQESKLTEEFKNLDGDDNDMPIYFNDSEESDINIKEKRTYLSSLKSSSGKRALSMFARWGPLNTIGKDRKPIRSGYPPQSFDSISTQTRGRMPGQPLRWG
ncbi:unnamed protein product [Ceutorhynchus assimilis]|uniref:Uncharacterized protein n=1 Tax=Ceutorhynchus assimilis TaxID=467358 RepID=A0A9N9QKB7_9CUCU|nr:unnamed protein product [Ceutorhynchus assimilis]